MTTEHLRLERRNRVALVTLDRPMALNALNHGLALELVETAGSLAQDPDIRAVVLTGAGRAFCSGADLSPGALPLLGNTRGRAIRHLLETVFNPIIEAWQALPKPVIVAQNGIAAGGGVGLALSGDFLLMAENASLVQVFVPKLGLVPDMGVSILLPRAIGAVRANALALTGAPLTATEALAAGAAYAVHSGPDLLPRALDLAETLARGPRMAHAHAKDMFRVPAEQLRASLQQEAERQEILADSADHAEGMAAFAEKRTATFT